MLARQAATNELREPGILQRIPGPLRSFQNRVLRVPAGASPDDRACFIAARVRISFALFFGAVYYVFYFREQHNPFYSHEHIRISMSADFPLRLAWIFASAMILWKSRSSALRKWNKACIVIESLMAFNLVLHTGAMTSYFLWIYPIYPIVQRIAFGRSEALFAAILCTIAAIGGALLTLTGLYPEAAWYAQLSRDTYRDPSVAYLTILILLDAMLVGPVLGEIAMHSVDLREQELREANASLEAALQQLERQQKALVEAESLAAIGEFVRGAAHEIGNPLGAARGILDSVREDLAADAEAPLPPEIRKETIDALRLALQSQDRVRAIVSILHDLSVHTEVKAGTFQLGDALRPVLEKSAEGNVHLAVDGDIPALSLSGNAGQLGDALRRVIENAREFAKSQVQIHFGADQVAQRISITVCDDGPGFSTEALQGALEPFFTTRKADRQHLGLGLFITRVLIGRMGGTLQIENQPSGGACVRIELPLAP